MDRIAAGEVVERPAAVVKELVENALDAGATDVTVEIRGGGVELVAVRDDGAGIPAEELPLAFASHATSKLTALEDLERIASLGFRGEALASIGAVSDCRIVTRTRGGLSGHEIECRGGALSEVRPAAAPEGTLVEVRGLFRHVPARRKFLRGAGAESSQVTAAVERAALANPGVAFTLVRDGRRAFRVTGDDGRRDRIARFHGADLAERFLPVAARSGAASVEGFVGRPDAARPTASFQHFFLNGRPIRDRGLAWALRSAFEGLLTTGRQPVAFLFLALDPAEADVNVHPAKSEVRFRDPEAVQRLVRGAVRDALLRADLAPVLPVASGAAGPFLDRRPPSAEAQEHLESVREALADYLVAPRPERPEGAAWRPATAGGAGRPADLGLAPRPRAAARFLQVRDTFLVFETDEGLAVVDQHALHERIRLEELHERLHAGGIEVQRLLSPRIVELPAADAELLVAEADALAPLGIEIASFGPTSVGIHALPALLGDRDPAPLVRDLVERLRERRAPVGHGPDGHEPGGRDGLVESVLHSLACRSAVMAGDPLTESQAAELLRRADLIDTAAGCAHGRPTALRIPWRDLERGFRR